MRANPTRRCIPHWHQLTGSPGMKQQLWLPKSSPGKEPAPRAIRGTVAIANRWVAQVSLCELEFFHENDRSKISAALLFWISPFPPDLLCLREKTGLPVDQFD